MNPTARIVRTVATRLTFNQSLNTILRATFYLICLFAVLALADKLFYLGFNPYGALGVALLALIPLGVIRGLTRPVRPMRAALAIDERLGLNERISTAMTLKGEEGAAAQAVLADAQRHAAAIDPRRQFPYQYPREMRLVALPALALALIWGVVPSLDLLHREAASKELAKEKAKMKVEAEALKDRTQRLKKKLEAVKSAQTKELIRQLEKASEDLKGAKDKKQAFLKLSELGDQLKGREEELQKILEKHKQFQPGSLSKLTKDLQNALAAGDFKAAQRQAQELAEKLREMKDDKDSGEGNKEKKEELARELDQLSEKLAEERQLDRLSDSLKALAKSLRQQGLEGLDEGLKDLEMSESDLAQLDQLMEEMEMIELALKELQFSKECLAGDAIYSEFCPSCGQKWCRTCGTDECECCEEGQVEKCKLAVCRGTGKGQCKGGPGLRSSRGEGQGGGGGRGTGRRNQGDLETAGFEKSKVKGQIGKGPVLGSFLIKGVPPKGETTVDYSEVVTHYREAAEEALDKERIPANYRDLVREYFESIEAPANDKGQNPQED